MKSITSLNSDVSNIPLVGPKYVQALEKNGVVTVRDFLYQIPFKYRDTSDFISVTQLLEKKEGVICATVESVTMARVGRYLLIKAKVRDESGVIDVVWFNQRYLINVIKKGRKYIFEGKVREKGRFKSLSSPQYELVEDDFEIEKRESQVLERDNIVKKAHLGRITPFYSGTSFVSSKWIRSRIVMLYKDNVFNLIEESIPSEIVKKYELCELKAALKTIHFPLSFDELENARKRLAVDELVNILIPFELKRTALVELKANIVKTDEILLNDFTEIIDFSLTTDQNKALNEVLDDINSERPMHRLLNGDVGSGKTIIAVISALMMARRGLSSVLMAPTSILAQQHFDSFNRYLSRFNIPVELITSDKKIKKNETEVHSKVAKIFIGTQALLFRKDILENVGLVIVDEQHRFGVKQRESIGSLLMGNAISDVKFNADKKTKEIDDDIEARSYKQSAKSTLLNKSTKTINQQLTETKVPHYLAMTATPIPRSLAQVIFGDVDISRIIEMPTGRIPVKSAVSDTKVYKAVHDKIVKSEHTEQAFIIYPLIEDSENLDLESAIKSYEHLKNSVFSDLKVGLLHGKMKSAEKDRVLNDFKAKKYHVLISTSVIEVGIDIPDATMMVIEGAERFGLAQLHQLRGRVGRGLKQSYCFLIPSKNLDNPDKVKKRLEYFCAHTSGFEVAEFDLKSRGPGEVFGSLQSGIPNLKVADIMDTNLVLQCKEIAKLLISRHSDIINTIQQNLFR